MFDDLAETLEQCRIGGRLEWAICLCVSEAFCNALLHGNKMDPEKTIFLALDVNQQIVRADITDQGDGDIENIRMRSIPSDQTETGRGFDLIERTANRLELTNNREAPGLTLRMEFIRSEWD
ncbi:MAG: ATP-binding protein [candidate division Zixibacteria bacterium]|nr:ATP-binding protein [candidate division Zixibacteria bacterium]